MFTIMGIDPGINNLGLATIKVNTRQPEPFQLIYADTLNGDLNNYGIRDDNDHQCKAKGLVRSYKYLLGYLNPDAVCCEDNYYDIKGSVSSFKRLIEIVTMMSYCTLNEKPDVPFHLVLPRLAKMIVNADFRGSTKEDVRTGLLNSGLITFNRFDLYRLTEHAVDAILIAVYEAVQLYRSYGWITKDRSTGDYRFASMRTRVA